MVSWNFSADRGEIAFDAKTYADAWWANPTSKVYDFEALKAHAPAGCVLLVSLNDTVIGRWVSADDCAKWMNRYGPGGLSQPAYIILPPIPGWDTSVWPWRKQPVISDSIKAFADSLGRQIKTRADAVAAAPTHCERVDALENLRRFVCDTPVVVDHHKVTVDEVAYLENLFGKVQ